MLHHLYHGMRQIEEERPHSECQLRGEGGWQGGDAGWRAGRVGGLRDGARTGFATGQPSPAGLRPAPLRGDSRPCRAAVGRSGQSVQ